MQSSTLGDCARFILAAPRSVLTWKAILPAWVWLWLLLAVLRWGPSAGLGFTACLALVALAAFPWLLGSAVISARHAAGLPTNLGELWQGTWPRLPVLASALCFTLVVPVLFSSIALVVALVGRVPVVGKWLLWAWMGTGGLLLLGFSAAWAMVGLPAALLEVGACAVEASDPMDVTTRAMSYVRRRPLGLLGALVLVVLAACLAALAFGAFVLLVAVGLHALELAGSSGLEGIHSIAFGCSPEETWELPLLLLIAAYFCASLGAGLARAYAVLRCWVDGTPLVASAFQG